MTSHGIRVQRGWMLHGIRTQRGLDKARDTASENTGYGARPRPREGGIRQEISAVYDKGRGLGENGMVMTFCGECRMNTEINVDLFGAGKIVEDR